MKIFRKNFLRKGFTLVEIMLVLAIIGTLSATIYPQITGYYERTRDASRIADIKAIALGLKNYRNDMNVYPAQNVNEKCVSSVSSLLKGYVPNNFPVSPSWVNYDEGCGTGGQYFYKTDAMGMAYVLSAKMEQKKSGNYNRNPDSEAFSVIQNALQEKTGDKYVALGGHWMEDASFMSAPEEISSTGGGTYTPTPTNCSLGWKTVNHWFSWIFYKSSSVPFGQICQSISRSCTNGILSADASYKHATCSVGVANNCTAQMQNGYTIPAMNHGATQNIFKNSNTPANGMTRHTATASCNNGNITITEGNSTISCNTWYTKSGNSCISTTPPELIGWTKPNPGDKLGDGDFNDIWNYLYLDGLPKNTKVTISWKVFLTDNNGEINFNPPRWLGAVWRDSSKFLDGVISVHLTSNPSIILFKYKVDEVYYPGLPGQALDWYYYDFIVVE